MGRYDETTRALEPGSGAPTRPPATDDPIPRPGDVFGRYRIEGSVGRGGMGDVLAAWDPELDRRVALKVLRRTPGELGDGREQLLAEAQALARLAHPNVVEVFDVGLVGSDLFLAMELIEGQTLREWLAQGPRAWPEVLEAFAGAGRGLAAAHAAGLVHGDFKPSNVLVGPGSRVRVVDFGLALAVDHPHDAGRRPSAADATYRSGSSRVIAGTPRYMAPEQWRGDALDARSDQFAFCVALYQALYGQLPFGTRRLVPGQDPEPAAPLRPPRSSPVPRQVWVAVARGLAHEPARRHASMDALLRALVRWRRPSRAWLVVPAVVGVAAIGAWWHGPAPTPADPCTIGVERLAAAWGPDAARGVGAAMLAADAIRGPQTAERVVQRLDAYAAGWAEVHAQACGAAEGSRDRELQLTCLDEGLAGVRSLVEVFERADASVVARAVKAVGTLEDPRRCADVDALRSGVTPPDPAVAERVAELRGRLQAALAEGKTGRHEAAKARLDALADEAAAIGYAPLMVEVLDARGHNADERGDWPTAQALLEQAVADARAIGHDRVLASAAIQLVFVVGSELERADEGLDWVRHAEAALERLGSAPALQSELAFYTGIVLDRALRLPEAHERLEQALVLERARLGDDHPELANVLNSLGIVCYRQGQVDAALSHLRQALALVRRTLGPDHDRVAIYGANLAAILTERGEHDEALALLQEGLGIWERTVALRHPAAAGALRNLGIVHEARKDYEAARVAFERARDISLAVVGPEHATYGNALNSLGVFHRTRGEPTAARTYFEQALAVLQDALGEDHPEVATVVVNLATLDAKAGEHGAALEQYARALATLEARLGPEHPLLFDVLVSQAESLQAVGRTDDAIAALERAVRIDERAPAAPERVAAAQRTLAELRPAPTRPGQSRR